MIKAIILSVLLTASLSAQAYQVALFTGNYRPINTQWFVGFNCEYQYNGVRFWVTSRTICAYQVAM
jgi:hypothetical protein